VRWLVGSAGLLLVAIAGAAWWMQSTDELNWQGPRRDYFLYLAALCAVAILLRRWPRISVCLLALALVEYCWGMGSFILDTGNGRVRLLPDNRYTGGRFQWHPLLQAVPVPGLTIDDPRSLAISHTAEGTRGPAPPPGSLDDRIVIAAYGGSTTYDIAVADNDTWVARLAAVLGDQRYAVINNGVPGYSTVEHVIQTAFYQDKFGRRPNCAIYYVGWNDIQNAHIAGLDPGFADFHMPGQIDWLQVRRVGGGNRRFSPLLTVIETFVVPMVDTIQYRSDPDKQKVGSGEDPRLTRIFERNVRTISAINRDRGVATIWVGQLVNRAALTGEGRYGWLPLVRDRDIWPMLEGLRGVLARVAAETGDEVVNPPIESFGPADFSDNGHFSQQGARRFADTLVTLVKERCR
jgi:lysophospholipase L1-like esterase